MQVVSAPDPDYSTNRKRDHLWLLAGSRRDYSDGATAYYLGHDREIEDDDLAGRDLSRVIEANGLNRDEAVDALNRYRQWVP